MEPRSEDDGDVHVTPAGLQGAVGNGLKAQGSHALPHVEGPPDGVVSLPGAHFWRDIFDALEQQKGRMNNVDEGKMYIQRRYALSSLVMAQNKREAPLDTTISGPAAFTELSPHQSLSAAGRQGGMANLPPSPLIFKEKKKVDLASARAQRRSTFY